MRTLSMLLLVGGVVYLVFNFTAPGLLPDFDFDPLTLGGGAAFVGLVLLVIDENGRIKRKKTTGSLGKYRS